MKISLHNSKRRSQQGIILVVTLTFAVLCGLTLASYMMLASQEQRIVTHSQDWNSTLCFTEAGVDEALAQINNSPLNFATNSWGGTVGTSGTYGPVSRTLSGGSYTVSIKGGSPPTIYSTGFVAVAGVSGQTISRRVKVTVTTSQVSPFSVVLGAVGNIQMNGNALITDSYDSTNPLLSTNGQYVSTKHSTNGSVATVGGILNPGNDTIQGNVYLGPTASYAGQPSNVSGTIYSNYNIQFPPATLPTTDTNGNSITWKNSPGSSSSHTYTTNGYYTVNDSGTITVSNGISVTLHVTTTSFSPSSITINGGATNAGSIVMYQDSGSITIKGNTSGGSIGNRPVNFIYYGLPGVTSIQFSGTTMFQGAIYAPNASLTLNGGGSNINICGALIVHDATDNGHYYLHYDQSLANLGSSAPRGYLATSWQEF